MTVYEGRDECRRLNVLKMWEETIADLERLGLSFLDPDFCNGLGLALGLGLGLELGGLWLGLGLGPHPHPPPARRRDLRASTARLQLALLKVLSR